MTHYLATLFRVTFRANAGRTQKDDGRQHSFAFMLRKSLVLLVCSRLCGPTLVLPKKWPLFAGV